MHIRLEDRFAVLLCQQNGIVFSPGTAYSTR